MRTLALLLTLLMLPLSAGAAEPAEAFAWQQHPGALLPLETMFRDETGQGRTLGRKLGPQPVILDLGYFHCPTLCGVVRADLMHALRTSGLMPGRDYRLVVLSIDPDETPQDAARAKAIDLDQAGLTDGSGWGYLTGSASAIEAVTAAVGFRSRFDPQLKQFMHPTGLVVLTGTGRVSSYLLGLGYNGGELRAAVLRAGKGGIEKASLPILLLCFHYDPATGRFTLAIEKVLRLMAVLTVLMLGGLLIALHRQKARP
jgi:protein SCO1/2